MSLYLATIGLIVLFIVDYIAIIAWLMNTTDRKHDRFRFSMRNLFVGFTIAAIHLGMFAAFLAEHPPHTH
jgi:uncharacterized membrane protein